MAYGDGSIVEVKNPKTGKSYSPKHWKISVSWGRQANGKYATKYKRTQGSLADARKVRDSLIAERDGGLLIDADKVTFAEYAASWYEKRLQSGKLSKRTLRGDKLNVERLSDVLGSLKLKDINAYTIEVAYNTIRTHPKTQGEYLSGTTMKKVHQTMNSIMRSAFKHDFIPCNPCDKLDNRPVNDTPEKKVLSEKEVIRLIDSLNRSEEREYKQLFAKEQRRMEWGVRERRTAVKDLYRLSCLMAVRLCLATGMRISETLAVCWQDVAPDCSMLHIVHAQDLDQVIKPPKSKAGIRFINLDSSTEQRLRVWKQVQQEVLATLGISQMDTVPICCSGTGGFINYANLSRWFIPWREEQEFPNLTLHQLRHTHATLLVGNNIDFKTVQKRLGHARASTTMDLYAHAIPENDKAAAKLLENIMS